MSAGVIKIPSDLPDALVIFDCTGGYKELISALTEYIEWLWAGNQSSTIEEFSDEERSGVFN
ncbi:MAG: hypothetical protein ACM3QX_14105 [Syntrophomonadaceae bacterium]